jgi:hypothetical protein
LNRQSLLGEHRELHGLLSILVEGKRGYANHPETRRWVGCLAGLIRRHGALAAEMRLRGYQDRTPIAAPGGRTRWPVLFIDAPARQFELLATKYAAREPGRIALPRTPQQLWAQHKYSVMARDPELYRQTGRRIAGAARNTRLDPLAEELVAILRRRPPAPRLRNALEHMWGHVSEEATDDERAHAARGSARLLGAIQSAALRQREPYLLASTALSELAIWLR